TPVSDVLPNAPIDNPWRDDAPLRLVHLLEHTGGLPGSSYYEYAQVGDDLSPSDYLARLTGRLALRWPPGRHYSYANGGHTIAARMLEAASGEPFDALMRARIFERLGMGQATFSTRGAALESLSESFTADGGLAPVWRMAVRPSGSLAASIHDMAQLTLYLTTVGASVTKPPVSAGGLRRMRRGETSLPARFGYDYAYGLGMFGFVVGDRIFWGHWGKTEGFLANLGVLPDRGRGFVLLSNTSNRRAMSAMRERLGTHLAADIAALKAPTAQTVAVNEKFTGTYMAFTHDMALRSWLFGLLQTVIVDREGDGLTVRSVLPIGEEVDLTAETDRFYRAGAFPVATHLFLEEDGRTVLFGDGQETYRKLGSAAALALAACVLLSAAAVVLSILAAVVILVLRLFGRARPGSLSVFLLFGAAGCALLSLFVAFAVFGVATPLDEIEQLGVPSPRSLLLLGLSLLWPLLTVLGCFLLVRRWGALAGSTRVGGVLVAVGYLTAVAALALQGWLPLVTWLA
ncbi:MAG: beta-lactamase family protein, partial [Minwuiales bacterium]|nr:beta-lactamase family protein [Minwuiales bacterium]